MQISKTTATSKKAAAGLEAAGAQSDAHQRAGLKKAFQASGSCCCHPRSIQIPFGPPDQPAMHFSHAIIINVRLSPFPRSRLLLFYCCPPGQVLSVRAAWMDLSGESSLENLVTVAKKEGKTALLPPQPRLHSFHLSGMCKMAAYVLTLFEIN